MKKSRSIITLVLFSSIIFLVSTALVCNAAIPKSARAKSEYVLAEKKFQTKAYFDAIKHLGNAKGLLGNSNSKIQYLLVKSYYELGAYDKAKNEMDLFFSVTPESESSSAQYNEIVVLISEIEEKLAMQEKKNAQKYYEQGEIFRKQKNFKQALIYYSKAINADPGHTDAYWCRADICHWNLPDFEQAIQDYSKIIELAPGYHLTYNNLAWLYATCKDLKYRDGSKAVELALKSLSLKQKYSTTDTLAAAYVENKEFEKAIQTYKKVADNNQDYLFKYQKSLKKKGLYSGDIDGVSSPKFIDAIRKCVMQGMYI